MVVLVVEIAKELVALVIMTLVIFLPMAKLFPHVNWWFHMPTKS